MKSEDIYVIIMKTRKLIKGSKIEVDTKRDIVVGNQKTAIDLYSNHMNKARHTITTKNMSVSIAMFNPVIDEKGLVLDYPKDHRYLLIENMESGV